MSFQILAITGIFAWWAVMPQIWPIAAGVLVTGLAGGLGWVLLRRQPEAAAPKPVEKPTTPTAHDPFIEGSRSEQRQGQRREGNAIEVFIATTGVDKKHPLSAYVVDRSVGGLCLESAIAFKEGSQLTLLPTHAPEMTPWTAVEVRSCRPSKDGFVVGCQFVRSPPWAILLLFG